MNLFFISIVIFWAIFSLFSFLYVLKLVFLGLKEQDSPKGFAKFMGVTGLPDQDFEYEKQKQNREWLLNNLPNACCAFRESSPLDSSSPTDEPKYFPWSIHDMDGK